jgi:hypothetical protein
MVTHLHPYAKRWSIAAPFGSRWRSIASLLGLRGLQFAPNPEAGNSPPAGRRVACGSAEPHASVCAVANSEGIGTREAETETKSDGKACVRLRCCFFFNPSSLPRSRRSWAWLLVKACVARGFTDVQFMLQFSGSKKSLYTFL